MKMKWMSLLAISLVMACGKENQTQSTVPGFTNALQSMQQDNTALDLAKRINENNFPGNNLTSGLTNINYSYIKFVCKGGCSTDRTEQLINRRDSQIDLNIKKQELMNIMNSAVAVDRLSDLRRVVNGSGFQANYNFEFSTQSKVRTVMGLDNQAFYDQNMMIPNQYMVVPNAWGVYGESEIYKVTTNNSMIYYIDTDKPIKANPVKSYNSNVGQGEKLVGMGTPHRNALDNF